MGLSGQLHSPAALPPEKRAIFSAQAAGWSPGSVWSRAENLAVNGIRSRTIQPVANRYTDYSDLAHLSPHMLTNRKDVNVPRLVTHCMLLSLRSDAAVRTALCDRPVRRVIEFGNCSVNLSLPLTIFMEHYCLTS